MHLVTAVRVCLCRNSDVAYPVFIQLLGHVSQHHLSSILPPTLGVSLSPNRMTR